MKFKLNFDVDAWISDLDIEAESEAKAKEQLYKMSLDDLISFGIVKDFTINTLDIECTSKTVTAYVCNIDYDVDPEDFIDLEDLERMTDDEIAQAVRDFKDGLAQGFEVTVTVEEDDDLDEFIADEICSMTGWFCNKFSYKIISTK